MQCVSVFLQKTTVSFYCEERDAELLSRLRKIAVKVNARLEMNR